MTKLFVYKLFRFPIYKIGIFHKTTEERRTPLASTLEAKHL
jgi:hypothetical protein